MRTRPDEFTADKMVIGVDSLNKRAKAGEEIGATEFKAKCLELMQEVHDRTRNRIEVTKRGKPLVRIVPPAATSEPLHGCLEGLAKAHGDLTHPLEAEWEALGARTYRLRL